MMLLAFLLTALTHSALIRASSPGNCFPRGFEPGTGMGDPVASVDDCRQVIDEIRRKPDKGITLTALDATSIYKGTCGATIANWRKAENRIDEVTLARQMTANILNPCIATRGLYGQWWSDEMQLVVWMFRVQ
ncbi:hypothetical protein VTK26DRAFT_6164 [Humicola hyalothermophila]